MAEMESERYHVLVVDDDDRLRRPGRVRHDGRDVGHQDALHDRHLEGLAVGEVHIEGASGLARPLADRVEARPVEALLAEQLHTREEELLPGLLFRLGAGDHRRDRAPSRWRSQS